MKKQFGLLLCAAAAVCAVLMLVVSCTQKKDRLVSNTLNIVISPQSVTVSTGAAKTFTAVCKSATSNNVDIAPQWTVDSFLGTFNPTHGKTTTFTATNSIMAVGRGKIHATYSDITASANVYVSSAATNGTITISPATVSLSTSATQSFTVVCKNANGASASIAPTWSVSPALGTFSPKTGSPVTFTPNGSVGSGTISAAYPGFNSGSAAISVTVNGTTGNGTITISTTSVSLSTGTAVSLSAVCTNSSGTVVSATPQWSVSPTTLGTFSPTTGSPVTFTATSLTSGVGSGTISAACSGFNSDSSAVSVTSNTVSVGATAINVYSDTGLISLAPHVPDIYTWGSGGSGLTPIAGGGVTGDTINYLSDPSGSQTYTGWGVVIDKNNASYGADFSAYASGHILFYLRTDRALTGSESVEINVEGLSGQKSPNITIGPGYGWDSTNSSWQLVTVPVSDVTGVTLTSVRLPFEITVINLSGSSPVTMDVDYVRWTSN